MATVLGGTSTAQRNQVMAELLDAGFARIPSRVREVRPEAPRLLAQRVVRRAQVEPTAAATAPQAQRLVLAASAPPTRVSRPALASTAAVAQAPQPMPEPSPAGGLTLASSARPANRPAGTVRAEVPALQSVQTQSASLAAPVLAASARPVPAPRSASASTAAVAASSGSADPGSDPEAIARAVAEAVPPGGGSSMSLLASPAPKPRSETVILAAMGEGDRSNPEELEIVSRPENSGRTWGVTLGIFKSRDEAEKLLLRSALQDGAVLGGAQRHVADTSRGFRPSFANLSRANAELVCERFLSRSEECQVVSH